MGIAFVGVARAGVFTFVVLPAATATGVDFFEDSLRPLDSRFSFFELFYGSGSPYAVIIDFCP